MKKKLLSNRTVSTFLRSMQLVWACSRGYTIASVLLLFVQGLLPLAALFAVKMVVDAVAVGVKASAGPGTIDPATFNLAGSWLAVAAGIAVLMVVLDSVGRVLGEQQSQIVSDHFSGILHQHAVELDLQFYENPSYFDLMQRARAAPHRPARLLASVVSAGRNLISVVGVLALAVALHPLIAVAFLVALAPALWLRMKFTRDLHAHENSLTRLERNSDYFGSILLFSEPAKEVRIYGVGGYFRRKFVKVRGELRRERLVMARRRLWRDLWTQGLAVLPLFGSYLFIARQTLAGALSIGSLVMYFQALQRGQGYIQGVQSSIISLHEDSLFLSHFFTFLDLPASITAPNNAQKVQLPIQNCVKFENVVFQYPQSDKKALDGVDIEIEAGKVTAFVGENGSGKTTLVKLLCRLYDPTGGRISSDDSDIRLFDPAEWRRLISVVFQDYMQYQLSVRDNIWLGDVTVDSSDPSIERAAEEAGASDLIKALPEGFDTLLGKWLNEGIDLSGGQWQKVALARAFLRQSQIVVLDEPSSAMDARSEYTLFERFRELMSGRTAVIISHRLSTVRMADTIYVLDNGRVLEKGNHDTLMRKGGRYAQLYQLQAKAYDSDSAATPDTELGGHTASRLADAVPST